MTSNELNQMVHDRIIQGASPDEALEKCYASELRKLWVYYDKPNSSVQSKRDLVMGLESHFQTPAQLVDQLGALKARISELEKDADVLRKGILATDLSEIDGELFRATVSTVIQSKINYGDLLAHLKVPAKTIAKFTTKSHPVRVIIKSRKTK